MTPLDEYIMARANSDFYLIGTLVEFNEHSHDRPTLLKAIWIALAAEALAGAWEGEDGPVVAATDPYNSENVIEYEKITYGDQAVIEAEGVIVWRIPPT